MMRKARMNQGNSWLCRRQDNSTGEQERRGKKRKLGRKMRRQGGQQMRERRGSMWAIGYVIKRQRVTFVGQQERG